MGGVPSHAIRTPPPSFRCRRGLRGGRGSTRSDDPQIFVKTLKQEFGLKHRDLLWIFVAVSTC